VSAYNIIRFEGSVDVSRYPEFRKAFEDAPRGVPLLVDLTAMESADSTFLSEMLLAKRRHGAPFAVLIAPDGHVSRLFEITNLGERMDVYADLATATEALRRER
jgi:anti-anti-sigma factor